MINYKKVGGIHFLAIGQMRFSFCMAKKKQTQPNYSYEQAVRASRIANDLMRAKYGNAINTTDAAMRDWMKARNNALKTVCQ
jgi:hypothetical protein